MSATLAEAPTNGRTKIKLTLSASVIGELDKRVKRGKSDVPLPGEGRSAVIERDTQRLYTLYALSTRRLRDLFGPAEQRWLAEAWRAGNPHGALVWFPGLLVSAAQSHHARTVTPKGMRIDNVLAALVMLEPAQELALVDAVERWVLAGSDPKVEPAAMG